MKKWFLYMIGAYLNGAGWILPKVAGKQAFFLFCTPFAAKIKPHQAAFLDTADRSTLQFEGKDVQMYRWGRGEKQLLCIHGWQSNAYRWMGLVESVDLEEYTVVALDAPAHGRSEGRILNVPIYSRLLVEVFSEIGPVHALVGHSIGCFAGMNMMFENPQIRPNKAILLASPGNAEEFIAYFMKMIRLSSRTERLMREYFLHRTGQKVAYYDTSRFGAALDIPGLIIHDRGDLEVPYSYAEDLHASWPASQLMLTNGLGHKLKGEEVMESLLAYIDGDSGLSDALQESEQSVVERS